MDENKHIVPLLIYDKLYTKKECQKILKNLGITYYRLQVLVTVGVEVQDVDLIPKNTKLYKEMKKAKSKNKLVHKFILQPKASL